MNLPKKLLLISVCLFALAGGIASIIRQSRERSALPHDSVAVWGIDAWGDEIDLSPDGRYVAISGTWTLKGKDAVSTINGVETMTIDRNNGIAVTRVYDTTAKDHKPIVESPGEHAAWSGDGKTLALLSGEWGSQLTFLSYNEVGGFDVKTPSPNRVLGGNVTYDFDFDREKNLFKCANLALQWDFKPNLPCVIWHWKDDPVPEPEFIDLGQEQPVGISSGGTDNRVRIAIAFDSGNIRILEVLPETQGKQKFREQLTIPASDTLKIRLTPDGHYLAVLDQEGLQLLDLEGPSSSAVWHVSGKSDRGDRWAYRTHQLMEISRDGRRIAVRFDDRIEVRTLPAGELLLVIPGTYFSSISLSSDGRRVAVLGGKPRVRLYSVPSR